MKQWFKPSDIEFLMRTFVFALLLLAILHAFKPYWSDSKAEPGKVEALVMQTGTMTADAITRRIAASEKPTMVVIFASWCGYCRTVMPVVHGLWKEGKLNAYQPFFISVDTGAYPLATYLLENGLDDMIPLPVIYDKQRGGNLPANMHAMGAGYQGGIPYIAFFGPRGALLDDINGAVERDEIEEMLTRLSPRL